MGNTSQTPHCVFNVRVWHLHKATNTERSGNQGVVLRFDEISRLMNLEPQVMLIRDALLRKLATSPLRKRRKLKQSIKELLANQQLHQIQIVEEDPVEQPGQKRKRAAKKPAPCTLQVKMSGGTADKVY